MRWYLKLNLHLLLEDEDRVFNGFRRRRLQERKLPDIRQTHRHHLLALSNCVRLIPIHDNWNLYYKTFYGCNLWIFVIS
jgi:hypothetical protein